MRQLVLFGFMISILAVSCGEDETNEEMFDYSVTIMSPDGADKNVGDNIHLHINFDEAELKTVHNIKVSITDGDGHIIYSHQEHVHETSGHYEHHADVILDVESGKALSLQASVWPDVESENGGEHNGEHGEHGEHGEEAHDDMVSAELSFIVN